jgi:hypothetical protein
VTPYRTPTPPAVPVRPWWRPAAWALIRCLQFRGTLFQLRPVRRLLGGHWETGFRWCGTFPDVFAERPWGPVAECEMPRIESLPPLRRGLTVPPHCEEWP